MLDSHPFPTYLLVTAFGRLPAFLFSLVKMIFCHNQLCLEAFISQLYRLISFWKEVDYLVSCSFRGVASRFEKKVYISEMYFICLFVLNRRSGAV